MKLIIQLAIICLMPVLMVGCSSTTPADENQMDDLNLYMLSHGHYIPNHE